MHICLFWLTRFSIVILTIFAGNFYVFDSCLKVKKVHNLYVNHLEPDPKVQYSMLYMHKITDSGNIVAGTNDSDILMILLLIV